MRLSQGFEVVERARAVVDMGRKVEALGGVVREFPMRPVEGVAVVDHQRQERFLERRLAGVSIQWLTRWRTKMA